MIKLETDLSGLNNYVNKIGKLSEIAKISLSLLVKSGNLERRYQEVAKANLDSEGAFSGSRWAKSPDKYINQKKRKNQSTKTLEKTGDSRKELLSDKGVVSRLTSSNTAEVKPVGEAGRIYGYHAAGVGQLPDRNVGRLPKGKLGGFTQDFKNELDEATKLIFRN